MRLKLYQPVSGSVQGGELVERTPGRGCLDDRLIGTFDCFVVRFANDNFAQDDIYDLVMGRMPRLRPRCYHSADVAPWQIYYILRPRPNGQKHAIPQPAPPA